MEYSVLGRTGLRVSVAGLGAGGHSRLGLHSGKAPEEAMDLVRQARELGVNFFDTAENYGDEDVVGRALANETREDIVICTKKSVRHVQSKELVDAAAMRAGVDASLQRLKTDYLDVFYLHGLRLDDYDYAVSEMVPVLEEARDAGKIRFLGVTEGFAPDPSHTMLQRAVHDPFWDVMMVGFNLLNPSARETVFPAAKEKGIGIVDMFAVRRALSHPERLREVITQLIDEGKINPDDLDLNDPLKFLVHEDGASSLTDAAYRFCRHEPAIDVVLFGTGNPQHLRENIESLLRPPLPESDRAKLQELFGEVDSVSGN